MLYVKWKRTLSLMLSICLVFTLFSGYGHAKDKGYQVLRNDADITQVMVTKNGTEYIATMDKKTHEITFETKDEQYVVELDQISTDKNGETYFEGKLINQNKSHLKSSKLEAIEFNKSRAEYEKREKKVNNKGDKKTQAVFVIPLVLALEAALEALLLTAAVITVGGLTYVLATELSEHLKNNKKYDYFAAYLYSFKGEGKKVVIGPGISKNEAQGRIMAGADILGRTKLLAKGIFTSVTRGPEIHGAYPDYLYHYHGKLPDEGGRQRETSAHSFYPGR